MSSPLRLPGFEDYPPSEPRRRRRPGVNPKPPSPVLQGALTDQPSAVQSATEDTATEETATEETATAAAVVEPRERRQPFTIDVKRSARRTRTVGAQLIGGVLQITVPQWMTAEDTAPFVRDFDARFRRKLRADDVELPERAAALAKRYGLRTPTEIRWVDDMTSRWASCTSSTGVIRMSSRLTAYPRWVLDYVIVHELGHLTEANHSRRFWELVNAYPLVERATGYLIAKSGDAEDEF